MTDTIETVLRWGILSTADIAVRRVIPAMSAARRTAAVALASRTRDRAEAVGSALSIPRLYGRYEDLLDDPDVDAIYIPLPNTMHAEWTIRAAQAGKHVLCEKPMASRVEDCEAMVQACRAAGVHFMEAFMYRFHPQHVVVRDLIASGAIGTPAIIRSSFCVRMQRPPEDIRFSATLGGGSLLDVGVYAIDAARWLADAPVSSVSGAISAGASGVDMSAAGALAFENGILASVTCSFGAAGGGSYEVIGPLGKITAHTAFTQRPGVVPRVTCETVDGVEEREFDTGINAYALMLEAFAESVLSGTPVPIPDDNGVGNVRVIRALLDG